MGTIKMAALLAIAIGLVTAGCAKKEALRPPGPEVGIAKEAFAVMEKARQAYVSKDESALRAQFASDRSFEPVKKDMKKFESVELAFTPRWVEIKEGNVELDMGWEGTWTLAGGGTDKERGLAAIELAGKPLKIQEIVKGSPFAYPQ